MFVRVSQAGNVTAPRSSSSRQGGCHPSDLYDRPSPLPCSIISKPTIKCRSSGSRDPSPRTRCLDTEPSIALAIDSRPRIDHLSFFVLTSFSFTSLFHLSFLTMQAIASFFILAGLARGQIVLGWVDGSANPSPTTEVVASQTSPPVTTSGSWSPSATITDSPSASAVIPSAYMLHGNDTAASWGNQTCGSWGCGVVMPADSYVD